MGGSLKPTLCIAKIILKNLFETKKVNSTMNKKRPDENFHQGVSIKIKYNYEKIYYSLFLIASVIFWLSSSVSSGLSFRSSFTASLPCPSLVSP